MLSVMNSVHFNALDLNLLRVFEALMQERSATRAGERLGLTQSAISHALNRLRYVLEDELFVRGPDGMQPTERAAEIAPRLRQGLLQLQLALTPSDFAPESSDRRFTITCTEYAGAVLMPSLIARLRETAPNASLNVLPSNLGVAETLRYGRADLAIVSQSDIAALLPRRLAVALMGRYQLALFEPPYTSPPFELMSLWHREHGDQPAVSWLRGILQQVAAEM